MNRIIKMDYLGVCNNEQVRGLLSYTVDYNKWTDDVERSVIMKDLFKKLQTELELKKIILYAIYIRYCNGD